MQEATQEEVLSLFRKSGALLQGHFILRSGLRSAYFFQCARVCEDLAAVTRLATMLIDKLDNVDCETVVAPAMGALCLGQEVARQLGKRFIFLDKIDGKLELRRGFKFKPGEKVLIVEDVITKGGRVQESLDVTRQHAADPVAVTVLVDRSQGQARFDVPLVSLLEMSFPVYEPDNLPEELKNIPAIKPGS
ncbi:MAG: orotate phosphoribosyltransferase [Verrucomicrobia bacterium CG_4_10_14_3_um_filter_43_23]|nr:MAG: orotate phosphoribosyltransferase [Verrucomicrobia bacterium CG22_combo_CG10-13_8_21_14_all_43_17]PIX57861.1 MAG: orotate phosphoribosyltransferase [Verrucomicrobia bacterium CG_4_10_14_3_um_filter_43_23]PIY63066.1 MAG: orotate phosphoribosyltransferase [Verrucomicrobia bacterium CG_4_10_14_0_8_um_filter_43_34]PJA43730.1 MAG: orotate phosphoribosyltransferase [Verrucomicrobia bacterium CG_4_9_14_3_um_filter_43_20]